MKQKYTKMFMISCYITYLPESGSGPGFRDLLSNSLSCSHIFSGTTFSLQFNVVCRNLCDKLNSKIIFGKRHYEGGKKFCRRCEVYYYHDGVFCPCCGMALRISPTSNRDKERLRQLKVLC